MVDLAVKLVKSGVAPTGRRKLKLCSWTPPFDIFCFATIGRGCTIRRLAEGSDRALVSDANLSIRVSYGPTYRRIRSLQSSFLFH